ncbi:hypothetical protein [Tessaracoccus caeni]|uniref:hypothetical protein n=1 Tax=Tessaracoccus caeni TaxID=3031239 RepID=UPI0023DBF607|nr:hypothetical protein [Tessaracoccus caeni]MDF1487995.1 hypothetical protein [Tessaracoccus caeni]
MPHTQLTELTDSQTREIVRRGITKGRRTNTVRRAASGLAALAIVGALGVSTFSLISLNRPDAPPVMPAATQTPQVPAESPADEKQSTDAPCPAQELTAILEKLLPDATVSPADEGDTTGCAATVTFSMADGKATGKVQVFAPGEAVLPEERIGIEQEDGSEEASVGYAAGLGDKQGQHDWYLVRDDDAAITLHVDAISGDERPTEKEVREVGTLLGAPELDSLLDEVAAG